MRVFGCKTSAGTKDKIDPVENERVVENNICMCLSFYVGDRRFEERYCEEERER